MKKYLFLVMTILFFSALPQEAFAFSAQDTVEAFFREPKTIKILDFGLILWALYQWYMYIHSFEPAKAFRDIIYPGLITWFAFNWFFFLEVVLFRVQ